VNLTISPQIRIVALVGVIAALGLGGSMLVLGRGGSKTETTVAATTHATVTHATTTPAKPVHPTTTPAKTSTTPAKHVAKPQTKTHTPVKHHARKPAGFRGNPVYAQLPAPLQWQLAHHKVVVVSIYNPQSDVDAISVAEAHAGAVDAGVGFLLVSVLDNKVAGLLTGLLPGGGLLPDPGVLVYRAPGEVAVRLDGFADRDAVAQAATNVVAGEIQTPTATVPATAPAATAAPAPTAGVTP
jgi:hypothetical protein